MYWYPTEEDTQVLQIDNNIFQCLLSINTINTQPLWRISFLH